MNTTDRQADAATVLARLAKIKTAARLALGFVWVWEGLVPKIIAPMPLEFEMVRRSGWWIAAPEQTLWWLGVTQVIAGLAIMSGILEKLAVLVASASLVVLMVLVIWTHPDALRDPFGGLAKDACLFVCAAIVWFWPQVPSTRASS